MNDIKMKRYEALAEDIAASIRGGVLRPGDRLPSVRHSSVSRKISPATVFKAYYLLEAWGLIRARERSGYFVLDQPRIQPPEHRATAHEEAGSVAVQVSERVFDVLGSMMRHDLVPFGSAFPSPLLFPLERLARAMASSVQKLDPWNAIDDLSPGSPRLRRNIALRYLADGLQVHTDEIVITNGALEALNLCLAAVTKPGDTVVVESPTFYGALQALERLGLQAIEVATHPTQGIDLAALDRVLVQHRPAACWLMTNFQNPLGSLMPDAKKKALVELLAKYETPLIEDDVYGELYFGTKRPAPAKSFDKNGLVMHCSSFSKSLAPGYRVGWAAPGRYARKVARHKLTMSLSASAPAQAALSEYLEKGGYDKHLRHLRQVLATQQREVLQAVIRNFPAGTRATTPEGGYFMWIELPAQCDSLAILEMALSQGISIAPGPLFSSQERFRNCLRLNYGHTWDARAAAALLTLGRIARSYA